MKVDRNMSDKEIDPRMQTVQERHERELAYVVEIFAKDPGRVLVYLLAELAQNNKAIHHLSSWCLKHGHMQGTGLAQCPLHPGCFDYDPVKSSQMPTNLADYRSVKTLFHELQKEEKEKEKEAKTEGPQDNEQKATNK